VAKAEISICGEAVGGTCGLDMRGNRFVVSTHFGDSPEAGSVPFLVEKDLT
jgi:hypothetical protein